MLKPAHPVFVAIASMLVALAAHAQVYPANLDLRSEALKWAKVIGDGRITVE